MWDVGAWTVEGTEEARSWWIWVPLPEPWVLGCGETVAAYYAGRMLMCLRLRTAAFGSGRDAGWRFPVVPIRGFITGVLLVLSASLGLPTLAEDASLGHWNRFRDLVPGHFQDWIFAGQAPRFTLIYSEPPPAFTLEEYGAVLRDSFRGYVSHTVEKTPLGRNGEINDLVVRLDYGSTSGDAWAAATRDLQTLSSTIYGTAHGARFMHLDDLAGRTGWGKAPEPVDLSALRLDEWLHGSSDQLRFFAPDSERAGNLGTLSQQRATGRFLSADNSVVALLIDARREINFGDVTAVRQFRNAWRRRRKRWPD